MKSGVAIKIVAAYARLYWARGNTVLLSITTPFALSLACPEPVEGSKGRDSANRLRQAQPERLSEQHWGYGPNAHSAANPNGEIRGQIGRDVFAAQMSSAQDGLPRSHTGG